MAEGKIDDAKLLILGKLRFQQLARECIPIGNGDSDVGRRGKYSV